MSQLDLSQQELPLTAYWSRARKENNPTTYSSRKRKRTIHDSEVDVNISRESKKPKKSVLKDAQSYVQNTLKTLIGVGRALSRGSRSASRENEGDALRESEGASSKVGNKNIPASGSGHHEQAGEHEIIDLTAKTPTKRSGKAGSPKKRLGRMTAVQSLVTPPPSDMIKKRASAKAMLASSSTSCQDQLGFLPSTTAPAHQTSLPTPVTNLRRQTLPSKPSLLVSNSSPSLVHAPGISRHTRNSSASSSPPIDKLSALKLTHARGTSSVRGITPDNLPAPAGVSSGSLSLSSKGDDDPFSAPVKGTMAIPSPQRDDLTSLRRSLSAEPPSPKAVSHQLTSPARPSSPALQARSPYIHLTSSQFSLVPSSQSQYLLSIDATPKRKRIEKLMAQTSIICNSSSRKKPSEIIPTSQSPEERELSPSMSLPSTPAKVAKSNQTSIDNTAFTSSEDLRTPPSVRHTPRRNHSLRKQLHASTAASPASRRASQPSFHASPNGEAGRRLFRSPTRSPRSKTSTQDRGGLRAGSRGQVGDLALVPPLNNVPPHEDDSATEPESDGEKGLVAGRKTSPGEADDSSTEPESDVENPQSIAGLGRRRSRLKSLARSQRRDFSAADRTIRNVEMDERGDGDIEDPPYTYVGSTCDLMRGGAAPSMSGSFVYDERRRPYTETPESFPMVVREFLDMFQGDGSYPDDFPESLRC